MRLSTKTNFSYVVDTTGKNPYISTMKKLEIYMGSTVLSSNGKNVGSFKWPMSQRYPGLFKFGNYKLTLIFETDNFQVWQGDVDERVLAKYPQFFD